MVIGFPLHRLSLAVENVLHTVTGLFVCMNLTPGISGLNGPWTMGPYAVDRVFTAWLRNLRASVRTCVGPLLTSGSVFGSA